MERPPNFIRFLTSQGLLSYEQAKEVVRASSRATSLLGQMMLRRKFLTLRQMVELLERQATQQDRRIGELAVEAGYLDPSDLDTLLAEQSAAQTQHPIDVLRRSEMVSSELLMEAMAAYIKLVEEPAGATPV